MTRVALFEGGERARARGRVLDQLPEPERHELQIIRIPPPTDVDLARVADLVPPDVEVLFCTDGVRHYAQLSEIAQRGMHLFLEWPPASSVAECLALAALGEEAGVEIGVSRPLRFQTLPMEEVRSAHMAVVSIDQSFDVAGRGRWKRALEDAVDLALLFARDASPRRIDAAVARSEERFPLSMSAGIRFHNGTYVHLSLRHEPRRDSTMKIHLAGSGFAVDIDASAARGEGLHRETHAFLDAVAANRPVPVSVSDALQTIRLVERLMERLRK